MQFKNLNLEMLLFAGLATLVIVAWFAWQRRRARAAHKLFQSDSLRQKFLLNFSASRQVWSSALLALTLVTILFALFDPSWGRRSRNIYIENLDILFVTDISNSMLADDVKPNRLERAKQAMRTIVSQLGGERVGIMAFARSAFYYCPFTADYTSFLEFLQALSPENIPDQGTEVDEVFEKSAKILQNEQATAKVVVILSDGEIHHELPGDSFVDDLDEPVTAFVLGIGTTGGAELRFTSRGLLSQEVKRFKTRLDETKLTEMAETLSAEYYNITGSLDGAIRVASSLKSARKKLLGQKDSSSLISRAHWFVLLPFTLWVSALALFSFRKRSTS